MYIFLLVSSADEQPIGAISAIISRRAVGVRIDLNANVGLRLPDNVGDMWDSTVTKVNLSHSSLSGKTRCGFEGRDMVNY